MPGRMSRLKSPVSKTTQKSPKAKVSGVRGRKCVFCEQPDINEDLHGKLLSKADLSAHYFCMLFSSGLSQKGKSEKQGILGFMPNDIMKEVKRGSRLRCSYCRKGGATIGCVVRNCKKMFHLDCGQQNGTLHQFFDTFSSFCQAHRPQQDVPSTVDPAFECSICMTTVECRPSAETLRAPCCRKAWYHRHCVQNYAKSAGLYFFKCPLCNNKDEFQTEMLTYGIYIPDQDASWETEPHAFQEQLERYQNCDAKTCRCAEGRNYDKEGSKWELLLCDNCGSAGGHVECGHLIKKGKDYICPECHDIDLKYFSPEKKLTPKRKSLVDACDLSTAEKQEREMPGPSNRMRKTGLPCVVSTSPDGRGLPASPRRRPPRNREGLPTTALKKQKRLSVAAEQDAVVKKQRLESPYINPQTEIKPLVSPRKNDASVIDIDLDKTETNDTKTKRLSLEDFKDGTQFRLNKDKKRTQKKRQSLQPPGTQKTLEGWLKLGTFKPREKSPQNLTGDDKKVSNIFTKKTPVKRPAVIEYRGEKLQIKSPRVLLRKNIDVSGNLKPRALQLTPTRKSPAPNTAVTTGKALLADLDNDFRVTRNMVSSADNTRSPHVDPSGTIRTKLKNTRIAESKRTSLVRDITEEMSEDVLTPRSQQSLLRSTEKNKTTPARKDVESILVGTPASKELRSSGKKKQPVSNINCRDYWTLSDNNELVTPTLFTKSEAFFSIGALDENCNNTPVSKSRQSKEVHIAVTHVSSKKVSLPGTGCGNKKSETVHARSSPVLRSATKLSADLNGISQTRTPERKSKTEQRKSETELSKATRSLTDLYQDSLDSEKKEYPSENKTQSTLENKDLFDVRKGVNSIKRTSELAMNDEISQTLQLTPKRKTLSEETPPRIKRSTKSLSELKSYKRPECDKPNNKEQRQTDGKIRRKTVGSCKTNKTDGEIWETNDKLSSSSTEIQAPSATGKSGRGRPRTYVSLLTGEKPRETAPLENPVIIKLLNGVGSVSTGVTSVDEVENKTDIQHTGINVYLQSKAETVVSDTTKQALKSYISKNKDKSKRKVQKGEYKLESSEIRLQEIPLIRVESVQSESGRPMDVKDVWRDTKENGIKSTTNIGKEMGEKEFDIESKPKDWIDSPLFELGMSDRSDSAETVTGKQQTVSKSKNTRKSKTEKTGSASVTRNSVGKNDLSLVESPVFDVSKSKAKTDKVRCASVCDFMISDNNNVKNLDDERSGNSPRLKKDKEKEKSLLHFVNETVEKLIGLNEDDFINNSSEMGDRNNGSPACNKLDVEDILPGKDSKVESQLKKISKKTVNQRRKSNVRTPEKTRSQVEQLKGSLEILKKETDKLSEKFIKNTQNESKLCENTCPNPQPILSKKSPRQGATAIDLTPLTWFSSMADAKDKLDGPEIQGVKTVSPGMTGAAALTPLYQYYSSLATNGGKTSGDGNTIRDTVFKTDAAISKQVNHLLKLKSPASKEIQAIAEQIKQSTENFNDSSWSGSRSEESLTSCPVRLSLGPRHVRRFSDSLEHKLSSNRHISSKTNGVRKEFNLLDNLEVAGGDVSSDKLAMSEYYSANSVARKDTELELDLDDIHPLTDIQS